MSVDPINNRPVYLCQVGPNVSCGACCGLYNVADPSPAALEAMLMRRTRWFADAPRTLSGIDTFMRRVEEHESQVRPFPDFHHCPCLGLIEDDGRRVGCLLHPLANGNQGTDWRGLSYYGGMACRIYFCPSVQRLPSRWLTALRQSADHWYLHGLVVTERRLLTLFFGELERRLGRPLQKRDFAAEHAAAALRTVITTLRLKWPFRRPGAPRMANYFFEDGLYPRPPVKIGTKAAPPHRFEAIFRELDTGFATVKRLGEADAKLEGMFLFLLQVLNDG